MAGRAVEGAGAHLRCTASAVSAEWGATPWLHSCFQAGPILPSRAAETKAFAASSTNVTDHGLSQEVAPATAMEQ
eukprot:6460896-Amphidinium_carterae.2